MPGDGDDNKLHQDSNNSANKRHRTTGGAVKACFSKICCCFVGRRDKNKKKDKRPDDIDSTAATISTISKLKLGDDDHDFNEEVAVVSGYRERRITANPNKYTANEITWTVDGSKNASGGRLELQDDNEMMNAVLMAGNEALAASRRQHRESLRKSTELLTRPPQLVVGAGDKPGGTANKSWVSLQNVGDSAGKQQQPQRKHHNSGQPGFQTSGNGQNPNAPFKHQQSHTVSMPKIETNLQHLTPSSSAVRAGRNIFRSARYPSTGSGNGNENSNQTGLSPKFVRRSYLSTRLSLSGQSSPPGSTIVRYDKPTIVYSGSQSADEQQKSLNNA